MSTSEAVEWVVTNVASLSVVVASFGGNLIPPADQLVQWSVGLLVAGTIIVFNVVRTLHYYREFKKPFRKRKPRNNERSMD